MTLTLAQQESLVRLIDREIETSQCPLVPKYQSYSDMHVVYSNTKEMQILTKEVLLQAYALLENKYKVWMCWFNILKEDSPYELAFHKHDKSQLMCVYYLKNCTGNGTHVLVDGKEEQLSCLDNTIQFMSSTLLHSIPKFNGKDRYSVAFDLLKE
jgi:hypothetical protein